MPCRHNSVRLQTGCINRTVGIPQQPAWRSLSKAAIVQLLIGLILTSNMHSARAQTTNQGSQDSALTLSTAIRQAVKTNPVSLAALDQLRQAEFALKAASAGRHFQLTFNSVGGVSNAVVIQPPPPHETFGAVQNSLTVPLPVGPKPRLIVAQAEAQLGQAEASYQSTELSLAAKVASAYFDLLRKRALVAAATEDLDTAQREMNDAQARNSAGDIPALDVLQAQVPVASDQAALIQAQSSVAISQEALNDLLGEPLDQTIEAADFSQPATPPSYVVEDARKMALANSPDVAAADAAVRYSDTSLAAAKRYADPAVSLQAIDQRSGDQTSFSREDTFQASVTLPIDDGGAGRANVSQAEAALAEAKINDQAVRREVLVTVSAAYLSAQSGVSQVDAALTARNIAQLTYDKTRLGFINGLYPLVDTLNAETSLAQAKTAYIQALYDADEARYTLDFEVSGTLGSSILDGANH